MYRRAYLTIQKNIQIKAEKLPDQYGNLSDVQKNFRINTEIFWWLRKKFRVNTEIFQRLRKISELIRKFFRDPENFPS